MRSACAHARDCRPPLRILTALGPLLLSACGMPAATFDARSDDASLPQADSGIDVTDDAQVDAVHDWQAEDVAASDISVADVSADTAPEAAPDVPVDSSCPAGWSWCGGQCVALDTPQNCGACGNKCPTPFNSVAACSSGTCSFECSGAFADCNDEASDGCEVNTSSDKLHCGACDYPCAFSHALASCQSSQCVIGACDNGFADCDVNPATGCEVDVLTHAQHCGGCNTQCAAVPNATATCSAGKCAFECKAGWGNCDANASNGCEKTIAITYRAAVLADGPIAYWRLGELLGNSSADASGHGLVLDIHPPVTLGQPGALSCDPDTSIVCSPSLGGWLTHAKDAKLEPKSAMSFELWMQQSSTPVAYEKPLWYGKADVTPYGSWGLLRDGASSHMTFMITLGKTPWWLGSGAITQANTWYHVVATYDGTMMRIYVNGVLDGSRTAPESGPAGTIAYASDGHGVGIGAAFAGGPVFGGKIDEVAVYDKALSAARVADHYAAALP